MKDIEKIKEFFSKPMEEVDINDPVLMKARAAAFQRTQPKPEAPKSFKNADKIKVLQMRRAQIMRDMEQEAEPEGGPIADRYGDMLNKIDKAIAMLSEAKKETAIDMAKKQLDQLGAKYEMSGNKFKPFKIIYKPIGKSDGWYDKFDEIVDLFNLGSAVKSPMNETSMLDNYEVDFFHTKANVYANIEIPSENPTFEDDIQIKGTGKTEEEAFEDLKRNYEKYKKTGISEAKKEDAVDTITMDVPLFIRMLEYSREDASQDMDLHDVTEKAISLGKERGILQMDDYDEIVGAAEEIGEGFYGKGDKRRGLQNASKLSSAEYQMAKKLKSFKASDWKWNADEDLYTKVNEAELTEAYVPSNIKEFAKRKGVSSLVNKVAGWAEKVGAGIRGGTAIGMNYSTLILDMTYQGSEIRINTDNDTVTLYDEPVNSFPEFKSVYLDNKEEGNGLEERISEALNKINEELCPAGKAYIKRRQAAGEKSSAYLSGRGVKVCKGLMSGRKKKK
jgi:hypothetical protein